MATCQFRRSVTIRRSPAAVFAFHLNPANLGRITPPWTPVARLELPAVMQLGARVAVTVRVFGLIPQRWDVEIVEVMTPERLVDVARSGPFPEWRHTHEFRAVAGGTEMTDTVDYTPPLGWLGRIADPLTTRLALAAMFRFRHARTRELLEAR